MYDIVWDKKTGGIILSNNQPEGVRTEIRPVFYQELDLLGFDRYWSYPRTTGPLLWATSVGRQYFYQGKLVAEAKGGSFFNPPEIIFFKKNLKVDPVDINETLDKNAKMLECLVQKSILFIRRTWDKCQGQYIIKRKLNMLELGRTLGNISEACRKLGVSRQHYFEGFVKIFYRVHFQHL